MLNWIHFILILGATQGFFLSVLLFHRHRKAYANRYLSVMMFLYSVILVHLVLDEQNFYSSFPFVKYVIETLPFLIGPLHYLYARSLIRIKRFSLKVLFLHALPALIYLLYRIYYVLAIDHVLKGLASNPDYIFYNWAINVQGLTYMCLTLRLIRKYTHSLKNMFSALEKVKVDWLQNITLLMTFLLLTFFLENFLFLLEINFSHFFNLTSTLMAVSVYALGYMGLSRSEVFSLPGISHSIEQLSEIENKNSFQGYQKSGLTNERAQKYQAELLKLMDEEQLFRDSNLTLSGLAGRLGISSHNLSEIMNTRIKMNFFDFINSYRVEQVKKDLNNPQKNNLTLVAIAFDAGFNSKSSFNAIFKKHTGKIPSEFRK